MDPLLRRVQQTIHEYQMLESGQTLLIAVSGGPDSMALLHLLHRSRERYAITLVVAHLDHQTRPSAVQDALFVESIARDLGLLCISERLDVPAFQRQHKLSPEDAARRLRYRFLRTAADRVDAHRIAVGHTADDQAETVLFRLLRGSGLAGLGGMPPVRQRIIRPLIQVQRRDLLTYLQTHHIPFRQDPSNRQRRYTRNRLRLDLIPALQASYNPQVVGALCTTAELLAADEAALQGMAQAHFEAARLPRTPGRVQLRLSAITSLPVALQRRVLRQALTAARGDLRDITSAHLANIRALLYTEAGTKTLALPRNTTVERRYDVLSITCQPPPQTASVDQAFSLPGTCTVPALGVTVVGDIIPRQAAVPPFPSGDVVWLDAARVGPDVRLRTRVAGDRFQPLGSRSLKKLKAFLIDAKIPRADRDRLPLLVTGTGIAWVAGLRIAEWAKVSSATRAVLRLQLLRPLQPRALDSAAEPSA
jgi:tRNA(Ile)-lysidine synthase